MEQSFLMEGLQMQYQMKPEKVVLFHLVENSPRFLEANDGKRSNFQVCCTGPV